MKFFQVKVILLLSILILINYGDCLQNIRKRRNKKRFGLSKKVNDDKKAKDGCVELYTKCNYSGANLEICEDINNFTFLKTGNWGGAFPQSMKVGKYIKVQLFFSKNYEGKSFSAKADVPCFKNTGFSNDPGSIQIKHVRQYTVNKKRIDRIKKERKKRMKKVIKQIKQDRKLLFSKEKEKKGKRSSSKESDVIVKNNENALQNPFYPLPQGSSVVNVNGYNYPVQLQQYPNYLFQPPPSITVHHNYEPDSRFKEVVSRRILAIEQKVENMRTEKTHQVVACWNAVPDKPSFDKLTKDLKMIWNKTQFNKDPGYFAINNDRTTVEVLKNGFYRIDAKIGSTIGSNVQAVLDINAKNKVRFSGSATTGNTQDATLVYYTDLKANSHFSVFIASTGSGPNNISTDPIHRLCIRKLK